MAIHVEYSPASIDFRPYREIVGSRPLLQLVIHEVRAQARYKLDLLVLCHEPLDENFCDHIPILNVGVMSEVRAFAEVASRCTGRTLALVPLGMVAAPPDLLERTLGHHFLIGADCTIPVGLPNGSVPIVASADFIQLLVDPALPDLPPRIRHALEVLNRAVSVAGQRPDWRARIEHFNAVTSYGLDLRELPEQVLIKTPRHIDLLHRTLVMTRSEDRKATTRYRLLKHLAVEESPRCQRKLAESLSLPAPMLKIPAGEPKPVLFASNPSAFSGAEALLCELVSHVDRRRFKPYALVAMSGLFTRRLREAGAEVFCPDQDFASPTVSNFLYAVKLLAECRPAVVHLNALVGPPLLMACAISALPVIQHVHVADFSEIFRMQLKHVNAIIAVSEFVKSRLLGLDLQPELIRVVLNGLDASRFTENLLERRLVRASLGVGERDPVILTVARYEPWKRQDLVVQAFEKVRNHITSAKLLLVGDVDHSDTRWYTNVKNLIVTRGLAKSVVMLPFQTDIHKIQAACDVMVLCSENEPLSMCVMEAMAIGLPVIVSSSGGFPEFVQHGKTGYITSGEPESIANTIITALGSTGEVERITSAARHYVTEALSPARMAEEVMAIWHEVLSGPERES